LETIGPGFFAMLSQNEEDRAVISVYDWTQDSWTHLVPELPTLVTDDLHILPLSDNGSIVYLLAWTAGGDTTSIWHAFVDEFGDVLLPPRETTLDSNGQFSHLAVRPVAGFQAAITAQYLEANSSIREFIVGLPLPGDCDGDGISDAVEIANGWATDENNNGIPDDCEIADGLLVDRDRNGVADLFEPAVAGDCNRNGIADSEEIFLGIATDDNSNGIPDECERVTRTVPLETGTPRKFYRATRIVIKTITVDDIELEYEGDLKTSDDVTGPWTDPQP
jgi:hypothetical protein